nr:MAG TPA: hypothetical protein [Caudoviricetes sp.]DAZ54877.1 MAG TPA: hypothetical protein [Caudoviricetes sp.]
MKPSKYIHLLYPSFLPLFYHGRMMAAITLPPAGIQATRR